MVHVISKWIHREQEKRERTCESSVMTTTRAHVGDAKVVEVLDRSGGFFAVPEDNTTSGLLHAQFRTGTEGSVVGQ